MDGVLSDFYDTFIVFVKMQFLVFFGLLIATQDHLGDVLFMHDLQNAKVANIQCDEGQLYFDQDNRELDSKAGCKW